MTPSRRVTASRGSLPPGLPFRRPETLIATWFGTGLLPLAPGTWGALATVPVAWALAAAIGAAGVITAAALAFAAGLWAVRAYLSHSGQPDPGPVVIDEVAGQLVAAAPAGADPVALGLAFVLFRIFDIWKPWPVATLERALPGALGVMADDIAAGIYAGLIVAVFLMYIQGSNVFF